MRIGDLRHRVTILQLLPEYDSEGEPLSEWLPVVSLWASKEPLLGREFFAAEQMQSKVEVKFRTRYAPGVTNQMRVQDSEGIYEILSAINVKSRNRELLMYCRKVR